MTSTRNRSHDDAGESELDIYVHNEGAIYPMRQAIERNLANKAAAGKYIHARGVDGFMPLMEAGAKRYAKEYATAGEWSKMFPRAVRREVAEHYAKMFESRYKHGEFDSQLTKVGAKRKASGLSNLARRAKGLFTSTRREIDPFTRLTFRKLLEHVTEQHGTTPELTLASKSFSPSEQKEFREHARAEKAAWAKSEATRRAQRYAPRRPIRHDDEEYSLERETHEGERGRASSRRNRAGRFV